MSKTTTTENNEYYKEVMLALEASKARLSAPTIAELKLLQDFLETTPEEDSIDRNSLISRMWAVMESELAARDGFYLENNWWVIALYVSQNSAISVLRLVNNDGTTIEHTRFDSGKLVFLDKPAGFPTFSKEVLIQLAGFLDAEPNTSPAEVHEPEDFNLDEVIGENTTTLDMWKYRAQKAEKELAESKESVGKRPIGVSDLYVYDPTFCQYQNPYSEKGWIESRVKAWHVTFNFALNGALGASFSSFAWQSALELANRTHGVIPMIDA